MDYGLWTMNYGLWTRLHNLINHRVTHILLWSKECGRVWTRLHNKINHKVVDVGKIKSYYREWTMD